MVVSQLFVRYVLKGIRTAKAAWILLGLAWVALYWPLLSGQVPAFRDAYHFYYPLEYWLDQQAQRGDIFPQFNPFDGTGTNLAGEMSTGLFYPGRILWWLPWLNVAQRMGLVLLSHTIIAGVGAAYAARRMRLGLAPQLLSATATSLSGPVFFQHVNPIYLIGAAWLPWVLAECWVLAAGDSSSSSSSSTSTNANASTHTEGVRWGVWIAGCSLILLAGDPQGTFHCGLISLMALFTATWKARSLKYSVVMGTRLALAVLAVSGLTAVQTLPTWHWYRTQSITHPQSIAEMQPEPIPGLLESLPASNDTLARGSPYAYSMAPWHLATLLWSDSLGHFMPASTRAVSAWHAEPRMWTASLSIGMLTAILAFACLANREPWRRTRFWWLVVLISGTAMLGNYAPMWMLRSIFHWLGVTTVGWPGDEVGGTYWMLSRLIPGYEVFRYPAKWSPIFAIGLTLCAAQGLENITAVKTIYWRALCILAVTTWLLCAAAVGLSSIPALRDPFAGWLAGAPADGWLGAIDAAASLRSLVVSFAVSSVLVLAAWLSFKRLPTSWLPWSIVLLVMLELGWSDHRWLVSAAPPQVAGQLPHSPSASFTRLWAASGQADITRDLRSLPSLQDKLHYQMQFALAKLHLLADQRANLSAYMSLTPRNLAAVRHQLALHDRLEPVNAPLDEALGWLGVQYRLVRSDHGLQWQAIPQSAALAEIENATQANTLHIKHFETTRIGLFASAEQDTSVVIRLLQDGGWRASLRSGDETRRLKPKSSHLGLFQSLDIPAGHWDIELRYQAPGVVLGAWTSVVTLILLLAISNRQKLRAMDFLRARTGR